MKITFQFKRKKKKIFKNSKSMRERYSGWFVYTFAEKSENVYILSKDFHSIKRLGNSTTKVFTISFFKKASFYRKGLLWEIVIFIISEAKLPSTCSRPSYLRRHSSGWVILWTSVPPESTDRYFYWTLTEHTRWTSRNHSKRRCREKWSSTQLSDGFLACTNKDRSSM